MEYKISTQKAKNQSPAKLFIALVLLLFAFFQLYEVQQKIGFIAIFNVFKVEYLLFLSVFFVVFSYFLVSDWFSVKKILSNQIHPIFNIERDFIELKHGLIRHRVYFSDIEHIEVKEKLTNDDIYVLRLKDNQLFPIYSSYPVQEILSEIKHNSGLAEKIVKEIKQ